MEKKELAKYIDQTLLSPVATEEEIISFAKKAKEYDFKSVCVNPCFVEKCAALLKESDVKVCTVIDFPFGASNLDSKIAQANIAINCGADELDFVVNLGLVKAHKWQKLVHELSFLIKAVNEVAMLRKNIRGTVITKLIIETCLLTDEEICEVSKCAEKAGFDFVKTSTGFAATNQNGATVHAVRLIRNSVSKKMGVKASGGIRTTQQALEMIEAGATRIGTSSSVEIIDGI